MINLDLHAIEFYSLWSLIWLADNIVLFAFLLFDAAELLGKAEGLQIGCTRSNTQPALLDPDRINIIRINIVGNESNDIHRQKLVGVFEWIVLHFEV